MYSKLSRAFSVACFLSSIFPRVCAQNRVGDPIQLQHFYNDLYEDNLVATSATTIAWAVAHGYYFIRSEGWLFPCGGGASNRCTCAADQVALYSLLRNSTPRLDQMLSAVAPEAGYEVMGPEGCAWVWPPTSTTACAPLQQWRSEHVRTDTASIVNGSSVNDVRGDIGDAGCSECGYSLLRIEACTPPAGWSPFPGTLPGGGPDSPLPRSTRIGGVSLSGRQGYYPITGADTVRVVPY